MAKFSTSELVLGGVFTGVVAAATMVIQIPMPGGQGFVNVGDTMIFVIAAFFGRRLGLVTGGLGSALADLISGYGVWAPFTLVIKGLEGYLAGRLLRGGAEATVASSPRTIGSLIAAALWMVFGYYVAGGVLTGFGPAVAGIPGNLMQGGASLVLSVILIGVLRRSGVRSALAGSGK